MSESKLDSDADGDGKRSSESSPLHPPHSFAYVPCHNPRLPSSVVATCPP